MTPRQTTEEVLRQYGEVDFISALQSDTQMGQELREMMETRGWKEWFQPMIDETMKKLSSIEGVMTIKDLEGRKQALSALKILFVGLDQLVDKANTAAVHLEQLDEIDKNG